MSLENEYFQWKKLVKNEQEKLAKFEAIEIKEDEDNQFSIEERIEARQKGINNCKESIEEYTEILEQIKEELIEFIKEGGEVSEITKKEIRKECPDEFKEIEVKERIRELGVYGTAYSYISDYLDSERDKKRFDAAYKQDWATNVEECFEVYSLEELSEMTSEDVERIIKEDHQEEIQLIEDARRDHELWMMELEKGL